MTIMIKILAGGAGLAALAAAAPATAQYAYGYQPNPYGYQSSPYGYSQYGYSANATSLAAQQCTSAVQARLNSGRSNGLLGMVLGTRSTGRVLSVTQVNPNRSTVRVRGLATSGRMAYNQYGVGAYGMLGSNYAADLSFKCDVDYRGYVRDVDINRR
jgi:hypothetical protein